MMDDGHVQAYMLTTINVCVCVCVCGGVHKSLHASRVPYVQMCVHMFGFSYLVPLHIFTLYSTLSTSTSIFTSGSCVCDAVM